jgi:hypothetical protein
MNLQTEYVEEHAANAGTIDLLEVETSERIRLERELNELRVRTNENKKIKNFLFSFFQYFNYKVSFTLSCVKDDNDEVEETRNRRRRRRRRHR